VETANISKLDKHGGMYPFKGDRICGFSVCTDDSEAYYIPVRHNRGKNLTIETVRKWLNDHLRDCDWVNHNIKFDAAFLMVDGVDIQSRLVDTLTLSKIHDSDRMGHDLKSLAQEWLGYDLYEERVHAYLAEMKTKDWADVPMDILGEYACYDVLANRDLFHLLLDKRPADLEQIWETEIKLTSVLLDMEMDGLQVNPLECKIDMAKCLTTMIETSETIERIADREFANSNQCIYDILINQFGLPILATKKERIDGQEVDTGRPTFNKDAMKLYRVHPQVTGELAELVEALCEYRIAAQHKSLFLDTFLNLHDGDNRVHPFYNQVVRTGRMSCSRPNAQQQNKRSKALIHPFEGYGFISCDYSQIEFRLIVHYINDLRAIQAYNDDAGMDFHQWVADMSGIKRKPAKAINFGMSYGAGKKNVTKQLAANPDIIEECSEEIEGMNVPDSEKNHLFKALCSDRADHIYEDYHERFPGIKSTAYRASQMARRRGYVFNAYGRRRHLEARFAHKAFNSIIQGGAMDIMKERMVALSPRYNDWSRDIGLRMAANVHDEVLLQVPLEILEDEFVHQEIIRILETPSIDLRVPIKTGLGTSKENWAEAAE
jgi:DNA polymerase-1